MKLPVKSSCANIECDSCLAFFSFMFNFPEGKEEGPFQLSGDYLGRLSDKDIGQSCEAGIPLYAASHLSLPSPQSGVTAHSTVQWTLWMADIF